MEEVFSISHKSRKNVAEQMAMVRSRIFDLAQLQRHHLVLDLNAGSGLLTLEAIRQVPEGGVYACVSTSTDANALVEQATALEELMRPVILTAPISQVFDVLAAQASNVKFDCIIGRNAIFCEPDKLSTIRDLAKLISHKRKLVLAETVPRYTQRLYRLLEQYPLDDELYKRLIFAEEAIYHDHLDPMLNWDVDDLRDAFRLAGLEADIAVKQNSAQLYISNSFLERLFSAGNPRPSYADRLVQNLTPPELETLKAVFKQYLLTIP